MQIESSELRRTLISIKEQILNTLDRAKQDKVKSVLIANISVVESILIWLSNAEKKGEANMEALKIGLGKTVKLSDITVVRSKLDAAIIEEASFLKEMGDARPIDPTAVNVPYFVNRVYVLSREGRIDKNTVPVRMGDKLYIALREKQERKIKA